MVYVLVEDLVPDDVNDQLHLFERKVTALLLQVAHHGLNKLSIYLEVDHRIHLPH